MRKSLAVALACLLAIGGLGVAAPPASATVESAVVVPTPSPTASQELLSVSCVDETFCVAVGSVREDRVQPLIVSWDGNEWTSVPVPVINAGVPTLLESVSCVSETFCVAVGWVEDYGSSQTVILVFDGNAWTRAASPAASGTTLLRSVSCVSETACVTVGQVYGGNFRTLALTWDGNTWAIQPTPNESPSAYNAFFSVSCVSDSWCTAVGYHAPSSVPNQPMAALWNGATWSSVPVPIPVPGVSNFLRSVSCASPTSCFGVGFAESIPTSPILLVWDGTSWSVGTIPSDGEFGSRLSGVVCPAPDTCVAVGEIPDESGYDRGLILVWDGTQWTEVLPRAPSELVSDTLDSVSCVSPDWCFTVGQRDQYRGGGPDGPELEVELSLAMLLSGPEPPAPTTTSTTTTPSSPDVVVPAFTG